MSSEVEMIGSSELVGKVEWIGIAAESGAPQAAQQTVEIVEAAGIRGEHHFRENSRSARQVTVIQHEHLETVAAILGRDSVEPTDLRRNIAVSGINVASLRKQKFRIGSTILQGTGDCVPCSLMEKTLGKGGYAAMVGHGGITCRVVDSGQVSVGDSVEFVP